MYPAIGVDNCRGNVRTMDTIYGISYVLLGRNHDAKSQQAQNGESVMQTEDFVVDVGPSNLYQTLQASKNVQHCVYVCQIVHLATVTILGKVQLSKFSLFTQKNTSASCLQHRSMRVYATSDMQVEKQRQSISTATEVWC